MTEFELKPDGGWAGAADERIAPPAMDNTGLVFRSLARVARRFGRSRVPKVFPVLHKHPQLFWAWLHFASGFMPRGKLSATARETCILRTAWLYRCRYEWGQHVEIALSAGMRDEAILALARGPEAVEERHDEVLVRACDELFEQRRISDATWQTLTECHDEARCIEITMLIGHYQMLAGFLNTAGLALEPEMESELERFHARIAGL